MNKNTKPIAISTAIMNLLALDWTPSISVTLEGGEDQSSVDNLQQVAIAGANACALHEFFEDFPGF